MHCASQHYFFYADEQISVPERAGAEHISRIKYKLTPAGAPPFRSLR